jgi:hypothetical protein
VYHEHGQRCRGCRWDPRLHPAERSRAWGSGCGRSAVLGYRERYSGTVEFREDGISAGRLTCIVVLARWHINNR